MDIVGRVVILGIVASIICLIVRRGSPELGLVLAMVVALLALAFSIEIIGTILGFIDTIRETVRLPSTVLTPVLRTVGIGIITRLGADICKDAGQAAIASAIELSGTIAAIYVALPLMRAVFEMIGGLL